MTKKVIVILSGGMDSATLLYACMANPELEVLGAVNFYYGSKHNEQERLCAQKLCDLKNIKLYEIDLCFINKYFKSDLLKSGGDIPEGHYEAENMKSTVVPFRNGIMISIATGLAESIKADIIALGNHGGDHAIYPDCRDTFVGPMKEAIFNGTWAGIELYTPFTKIDKTGIATIGNVLKVPFEHTYTCYKGGVKHCGVCGSCTERRESFKLANVTDVTEYEV